MAIRYKSNGSHLASKVLFGLCLRLLISVHEKAAPFLGPLSQKRQDGKESGKAMQGADPANGAAQKEMSVIESEGHSLAASFIDFEKVHFLLQRPSPSYPQNDDMISLYFGLTYFSIL